MKTLLAITASLTLAFSSMAGMSGWSPSNGATTVPLPPPSAPTPSIPAIGGVGSTTNSITMIVQLGPVTTNNAAATYIVWRKAAVNQDGAMLNMGTITVAAGVTSVTFTDFVPPSPTNKFWYYEAAAGN
jgi:hypothetical protein